MRRIWPLRNVPNFIVTVFGISTLGLYGYSLYKQQQFSHPIIGESIKVLSNNQKIKEIIGYPLTYQGSLANTRIPKGEEIYYSFKVAGPRATVDVEMNSSNLRAHQIGEKTRKLQKKIATAQEQLITLKNLIKQTKNRDDKKVLQNDQKLKQVEIQTMKSYLLKESERDRKLVQRYYIPEQKLYTSVISNKAEKIPEDARIWAIDSLMVQLPNRTKLTVYDSSISQQHSQKKNTVIPTFQPINPNSIKEKLTKSVALSQEQVQQYGKHKTNFMYQKYGTYRLSMMICFVIACGLGVVFMFKNRHKPLSNTLFIDQAERDFKMNPQIQQIIAKAGGKNIKWDHGVVSGGMKGNFFDCKVDVEGVPGGKAILGGKYIQKDQKYQIQTFLFEYRNNGKKQTIDLLK